MSKQEPSCLNQFDAERDECWECAYHHGCKSKAPEPLTGWDMGLLIRLERFKENFHDVTWCHQELINECGWPKGGEKEVYSRLMNLWRHGCLTLRVGMSDLQTQFQFYKYPDAFTK